MLGLGDKKLAAAENSLSATRLKSGDLVQALWAGIHTGPPFNAMVLQYDVSLVAALIICPRTRPPMLDQALFEMVKVSARAGGEDDGGFVPS